ncbi:uncharacterized protein MEPE_00245 [Melanopsichium pennsylvanicum]|uniref:Uncharacterized protein n=2 Tax=Melanopsichium pennsylvanicum TaxID=63383 RepID=A0AAJ5C2G6_9BASI|nr:putative protein [Melanopsichium pennsylvanicum 4]SNX81540.1 uncharacterized protein MEPE_00245 [Melanopsichium pennsylvanicum]
MGPILGGRRGRTTAVSSQDPVSSFSSSRRHSGSSNGCRASVASSHLDDWRDGFTGIVDLDRRMRELAMTEQGLDADTGLNLYEPYSPSVPSWDQSQRRRKSSSDARSNSGSQSSLATGKSILSFTHAPSTTSTAATSTLSSDSRAHSSLLSKRRSSVAETVESFDSAHSHLRLAPLPASPQVFGNYRLTDAARQSCTFSSPSWSSLDETDPLTPLAVVARQSEPITPGTAAAATWTDPSAPGYFPAGLNGESKRKSRSLRKKAATRAPLPRLVSGEVGSSPAAESEYQPFEGSLLADKQHAHPADAVRVSLARLSNPSDVVVERKEDISSPSGTQALRRSAQSLALSLRFKMLRAKRKVKRTGKDVSDLLSSATGSRRSSLDAALST